MTNRDMADAGAQLVILGVFVAAFWSFSAAGYGLYNAVFSPDMAHGVLVAFAFAGACFAAIGFALMEAAR